MHDYMMSIIYCEADYERGAAYALLHWDHADMLVQEFLATF